jgi:hypothetical protein
MVYADQSQGWESISELDFPSDSETLINDWKCTSATVHETTKYSVLTSMNTRRKLVETIRWRRHVSWRPLAVRSTILQFCKDGKTIVNC